MARWILPAAVLLAAAACSSPAEKAIVELERRGIEVSDESLLTEARKGEVERVRLLLKAGVSPEAADGEGYSALAWAASKGHEETVLALLESGADVNRSDRDGDTPLMSALINGESAVARSLLSAGANPNARNSSGEVPLEILLEWEGIDLAEALLEVGADPDEMVAGDLDREHTLLAEAAYRGRTDVMRAFFGRGADVNRCAAEGDPPIVAAARAGMSEAAELLVEWGAAVDKPGRGGRTALSTAVGYGDLHLVNLLLGAGADPDLRPGPHYPPLIQAAIGGNREIIEALIARGADLSVRDHGGRTAVKAAQDSGNGEAAAFLRDSGVPAE